MPKAAKGSKHGQKHRLTASVSPALHEWVKERTGEGACFASISHAVERGFALLKEHEEGKWVPKGK